MKRAFALVAVSALAVGLTGSAIAKTAAKPAAKNPCASKPSKWQRMQCEEYDASAPGDEYFGRMKMSYLGINNTFRDESIRAGAYTTDHGIISKVSFADESLRAWSSKYPRDPQLARSFFLASQMYKKIYVREWQGKAWQYMHLLVQRFPTSYFGKLVKKELAIGFTQHYFTDPVPCATPLPPGVHPTSSPSPEPTPSAAPGKPKVDVMTPPCIAPTPTPAPESTASPHR